MEIAFLKCGADCHQTAVASADSAPQPTGAGSHPKIGLQVFRCHLCLVHCLQVGDAFLEEQKYNHIIIVKLRKYCCPEFSSSAEFIVYRAHQPFRASLPAGFHRQCRPACSQRERSRYCTLSLFLRWTWNASPTAWRKKEQSGWWRKSASDSPGWSQARLTGWEDSL